MFITMYIRLSVQMHSSKKIVKALDAEVSILRNRPIEESVELIKGVDQKEDQKKSPFGGE